MNAIAQQTLLSILRSHTKVSSTLKGGVNITGIITLISSLQDPHWVLKGGRCSSVSCSRKTEQASSLTLKSFLAQGF